MFKKLFGGTRHTEIGPRELYAALKDPQGAAFIDIRRGDEWNAGHIKEFTHIPLSELPSHIEQLRTYAKIYFICRSGERSKIACEMMRGIGYNNAVGVKGGLIAWAQKQYPVVSHT